MSEQKPREFTFSFVTEPHGFSVLWDMSSQNDIYPIEDFAKINVIEKSAYIALKAENEKLRLREAFMADTLYSENELLRTAKHELLEALRYALPYLKTSTDLPDAIHAVMIPPAENMRRAASELEKKDAEITKAREALKKWGGE